MMALDVSLQPLKIEEPFHGAVMHQRLGRPVEGGIEIRVQGTALAGQPVTVQGQPARRDGRRFTATVVLRDRRTEIVAASAGPGGPCEDRVSVVWDRHSRPRYRFSIDDNSFFLRDVAQKQYKSLFDCFYLKMLRDLHAKYGAKFVLNIYYTTADGFDLTQFPDRYRPEWRDNADWLRLAFHAYADKPDRPYQDAPVEKLTADFDLVAEQIRRFAPEAYSPPTVVHWAMVRPEALKPLAERGVRVLSGFFHVDKGDWDTHEKNGARKAARWDINYSLAPERCQWLWDHDALVDFASGIVFSRVDIVCNNVPLDRVVPTLEEAAADPNRAEIMDLFTHEQYFWPFYQNYLPDHPQRLDAAIRFVTERGYQPVFFHEGFLGGPE